jgi:hypothetical protein
MWRAVLFSTHTPHDATDGPTSGKSQQKLWREKANRHCFLGHGLSLHHRPLYKLTILTVLGEYNIGMPSLSKFPVIPSSQQYLHVIAFWLVWPRMDESLLCSWTVCKRHAYTPNHVEVAQFVDDATFVATSRSASLFDVYLEKYIGRLEHRIRD